MRWRATDEFSCQVWTIVLLSFTSVLAGLGQIALGIWLVIFSRNLTPIIKQVVIDAYYGYIAVGAFATLAGLIGIIGSLLRRQLALIAYMTMLGASMLFMAAVSAFLYIEQTKVSAMLPTRIADNPEYYEDIDFHFNCQFGLNITAEDPEIEACSEFVLRQLWTFVWAKLGLSGFHICLEFLLLVMALMLSKLLRSHGERVGPQQPAAVEPLRVTVQPRCRDTDSTTSSSTTTPPFFSRISSPAVAMMTPRSSNQPWQSSLHFTNRAAISPTLSPSTPLTPAILELELPPDSSTTTEL